jgi:hypothetical protein
LAGDARWDRWPGRRADDRGGGLRFYELTVGGLVVVLIGVWNLTRSTWGLRLRALRDAPGATVAAGFAAASTRITVYGVSSLVGALAGWYLVQANASVVPSIFSLNLILVLFAGLIIGGPGTLIGPAIGAAILEGYTQFVGPFSAYNAIGLGLLLFVVIALAPSGVRNAIEKWRPQLFSRKTPMSAVPSVAFDGEVAHRSDFPAPTPGTPFPLDKETSVPRTNGTIPDRSDGAVPALEVRGVRKSFGPVEVLCGVDMTIAAGQIVGRTRAMCSVWEGSSINSI